MPPATRSKSAALRRRAALAEQQEAFHSKDINTGVEKLRPEDLLQREAPTSAQDAFRRCRKWHRDNWFVEQVCIKKQEFYNFGLRIAPKENNKANRNRLKKWLENEDNKAALNRYIEDVWDERILLDTGVSFWRKEMEGSTPFVLMPEDCKYTDAFGIEKLRVRLEIKKGELKGGALDNKEIDRYTSGREIELDESRDEYFRVLTRGRRGQGFGYPRLYTVFRTCGQAESMEIGEAMYAMAGRMVERTHELGFEVKSAANAMRQADYLWKKKRADKILDFYKAHAAGLVETTRQFDHKTRVNWIDPSLYDARKWETIINRLMWWGGPLAFMFMAKSLNPFLLPLLKTEAAKAREQVGAHLEYVINRGFKIGTDIKLAWGDECFLDMRLAWDMIKTFTQQGSLSLTTGLTRGGFDAETELENKDKERKEKERWMPLFDKDHGNRPGEEPAGRPRSAAVSKEK